MRVSRRQAAENRERIVEAASALFRSRGFGGIGLADIMKAADLTHGGFYGHFGSKDELIAEASRRAMGLAKANWTKTAAGSPDAPFEALLSHYLSPKHRDDPGRGCIFAALGADAARSGAPVRKAFAEGLNDLIEILAEAVPGRTRAARRKKAVAAMASLVGALVLSRAVNDKAFADEILGATRHAVAKAAE